MDFVVEAVVESEPVKKKVLAEVEGLIAETAILTSNTSTISITRLATALQRPGSFCGMHFFNPVPRMPLVEVIRGEKSSEEAVATAVAYAQTLGKTPIVVNDCPGFLVNRVLFPYFAGFLRLVKDGVDYERIDKVMEKWGWPMGPALLLDVIGLDTGVHADNVMAAAFPDRMGHEGQNAMEAMVAAGRLGQKNGKGFYAWKPEKKGPPSKQPDPEAKAIAYGPAGAKDGRAGRGDRRAHDAARCSSSARAASRTASSPPRSRWTSLFSTASASRRSAAGSSAGPTRSAPRRSSRRPRSTARLGALYAPTAQLQSLAASGRGFHGE